MPLSRSMEGFLKDAPLPLAVVAGDEHRIVESSPSFDTLLPDLFEDAGAVAGRLTAVRSSRRADPGFPARARGLPTSMLVSVWALDADADESPLAVVTVGVPDDGGDGTPGVMGETLRQVNEALLLRALRARERAEDARAESRAKSVFLASISHELRTPLNSIVGHAELLSEGIPVELPEPLHRHVERIRTAADHLLDLIQQIISASRTEIGDEPELEDVSVEALAREVHGMVAGDVHAKGLHFELSVADGIGTLRSNERHLRQILVNLLSNAVKFTEEGSIHLVVEDAEEGGAVRFRVTDTGIGIPEAEREKIFERFWQGGEGEPSAGMGIGLWVAHTLVSALGGRIEVESEAGDGTTFTVTLPRRSDAGDAPPRDG